MNRQTRNNIIQAILIAAFFGMFLYGIHGFQEEICRVMHCSGKVHPIENFPCDLPDVNCNGTKP